MALFGYSIWDLLPKKTTEEFWGNELEAESVSDTNEALEAHQQILQKTKEFMQTDEYKNASEEDQQFLKDSVKKILAEIQPMVKGIDQYNEALATSDENRRRQQISQDTVSEFDYLNNKDGLLGNITGQAFYALTDAGKNAYENTINQAKALGSIGANVFGFKDTARNLADEIMQSQMDMNAIMTPAEYDLDNGLLGSQNIRFATNSASQLASLIGSPVNVAVSKGVGAVASGIGKMTGLTAAAEKFFGAAVGSGAEGIAAASNELVNLNKVPLFFGEGLWQVTKDYAKGMVGYALGKTASALPTWASMSLPELYKDALEYDENGNVVIPNGERMSNIALLAIPHAVIENFGINPQTFGTVAERLTFKQYFKQYLKALAEEPSEELYQNWIGKIEKEWGKEDPNTGKKQNLADAVFKASQQFSSTDKQQLQENLNEALGGFFGALAMFPADHKLATTKYLQMQEQYRKTLDNIAKGVDQQAKLLEDMGIADFSSLRQSQQDLEEVGRLLQAEEAKLKENKFENNDDRRTCIQTIATLKQEAAQIGAELQDAAENAVKDYAAGVDILNQMQEDYINQQLAGEAQINPSDNMLMPRIDQAKEAGRFDTSKYQPQIDQNIKTYKGQQQLVNEALKKRDELEAKNPKLKEERLAVEAENQKKIDEENAKGKPKSRSKAELDRLMEEYRNGDFVGNFNDFLRAKDAEEAQAEKDVEAQAQKEFGNTETRDQKIARLSQELVNNREQMKQNPQNFDQLQKERAAIQKELDAALKQTEDTQKPAPEGFRYSKDQDGKITLERDPNFTRSSQDLSSEALKTGEQTAEGLKSDRSTKIGNETIYDTKKDAEYAAAKMLEQDIKDGKVKQGTKLGERYNAVKTKYGYVIREAKKAEPRTKTLNGKNAVDKIKAEKKIAAINDKLQKRKKKNKKGKNVKVVLVEDQKEVPNFEQKIERNAITGVYEKAATYVEGASDQNGNETTIYIVRNNIEDEKKLDSIITHELVHAGLRNVLNKNQQRYLLHETLRLLQEDRSFRDKIMPEMAAYGDLLSAENILENNGLNVFLEEVLARLAETMDAEEQGITGKMRKIWNNIVSMFYRSLRSLGLTTNLSKAEIPEILKGLRNNLTGTGSLYHFSTSQYGYEADAKAMFRADNMKKAINKLAKRGDLVSYDIDGKPMFSLRTWEDGGRSVLAKYLKDAIAKKELSDKDARSLLREMDEIYKECKILANKDPESEFGKWSKVGVDYDSEGKPYFTVVRQNGDYAMNIDFSTVCKKRRALNNVLNEIVKRGYLKEHGDLTKKDVVDIQEAIKAHGFEVACALCFVDSKRYNIGKQAKTIVSKWNKMFKSYQEGTDLYKNTMKELQEQLDNGKKAKNQEQRIAQAISSEDQKDYESDGTHKYRRMLTIDWLISSGSREMIGGHDNLAKNYPRIFDVLNGYGSGKSKNSHMDVAWNNDIIASFNARNNPNVTSFNPEKAFSIGGVRIQSFSDFIPTMFFDYVQCISELEAKKLPSHAYTKEADFVKLFGSCGIKTNMSFVYAEEGCREVSKAEYDKIRKEKGDAYVTSYDEKGKTKYFEYLYTDLDPKHPQSFNPEEAFRLRTDKRYEDSCGTIAVGVSDQHVRTLLRDKRIDQVIPYHKSGIAVEVAVMRHINNYSDYTNEQTERDRKSGYLLSAKGDEQKAALRKSGAYGKHFDFYGDLAKTNDPKKTAKNYLQWCKDNNLKPKFEKFTNEENYYKLLADFKLYKQDAKGNDIYIPQQAVKLNLNDDWQQVLTAALDVNQQVADKFNSEIDNLLSVCKDILDDNKELAKLEKKAKKGKGAVKADKKTGLAKIDPNPDKVSGKTSRRNSLGGVSAATANIQSLNRAMDMLKEGKSAQDVWFNTGWYIAKDGKPRFEISDKEYDVSDELKNARIEGDLTVNKNNQQMMLNTEYPISKIIKHDALFKAYPELEQIRVNLYEDAESKSRGSFGGKNISINLSKMLGEDGTIDPKKIKRTLIHELQHGIQRIEGFAVGSSKFAEKNVLKSEYGRRHKFTQEELDDIETKADDRYRRHYGEGEARAVADRLRYYDKDKESGEFLRKYGNMPEQDFDYDVNNSIIAHDENFVNQKTRFSKRSAEIDKQLTPAQIKNRQLNNAAEPMSKLVTLQGTPIKRYDNKVGKFVTGQLFVHKDYADEVIPKALLDNAKKILKKTKPDFKYRTIRWDTAKNEIRFDEAPNFDTAPEPIAGNTVAISDDGKVTEKYAPNIWHHKWMWVKDDYKGFDTRESWERSRKWLNGIARLNLGNTHPDYSVSNRGIANGSAYGYGAWNNQLKYYGLDDLADDPKNVMPKDAPKPKSKTRYSLRTVKPVYPSSEAWYRGKTLTEYKKQGYPIFETASEDALSEAQKDAIDSKNGASGTANTSTIPTYKKLFEDLKKNDPNWNKMRILDASSGLGQGTIIGRDMGFNVTDLEPFVSKDKYGRKAGDRPAYVDYDLLEKKIESGELEKFDYVISNAVLNVLPQDERDNMVAALSHLVRDGGKIFINTIGKDYQTAKDAKEPTAKNSKGQPYWKISKSGNPTGSNLITEAKGDTGREVFVWASNSPQKVFSKTELTAYLKDALGDDFVISNTPKGIGNTAVVLTKKESKDNTGKTINRTKKDVRFSLREVSYKNITDNVNKLSLDDRKKMAIDLFNYASFNGSRMNTYPADSIEDKKSAEENWGKVYLTDDFSDDKTFLEFVKASFDALNRAGDDFYRSELDSDILTKILPEEKLNLLNKTEERKQEFKGNENKQKSQDIKKRIRPVLKEIIDLGSTQGHRIITDLQGNTYHDYIRDDDPYTYKVFENYDTYQKFKSEHPKYVYEENFGWKWKPTTRYSLRNGYDNYDKPIRITDVKAIQQIKRKSISDFTSNEIKQSQKWAHKYYQELGTKSPFFRNWFGDWRTHDKTKVDIVSIPAYDRNSVNSQKGEVTNKDTDWNIRISRNGLTNTWHHAGKHKLSVNGLPNLKGLIENAVLLDTETHETHGIDSNNRIAFDHKLYALGEDENGEIALYKMTVEEIYQSDNSPYEKRFHNLKYIEKVADGISNLTDKPNGNRAESAPSTTSKSSVAEIYNYVKQYDGEFLGRPDKIDPRLLDEDGKPLIVYHGTDAEFDAFDYTKGRSGMDIQGMFFSPFEIDAKGYGKNLGKFYLNLRNPANEEVAYKALRKFQGQNYAGKKAREYLIKQGYDGVIMGVEGQPEEYIAFYPEQIKSYDENIGTYDRNEHRFRYSLRNVDGSKKTNEELWREQQAKFSKIIEERAEKEKNPQKRTLRENLAYMADRAEYNFTNKRHFLKKWQTDLEKNLADDPDYADLFENGRLKDKFDLHMMFDTYHGKVQTKRDDFTREYWDPIYESVTKNGVKYEDLNKYLFARHAEERDHHVQSINPEYAQDGHGSGWQDEWGTPDEVIESIEKKYGKAVMQDIGTKFDKLNDKLLDWQVRYHLISQEAADTMRNTYKHYTPLKRFDDYIRGGWDEDPHELNISQDIRAKALGRKSTPEHMLTFVKANIDTVFRRGERNLINLALLDLALRTNDPIFDVNRKLVKRVSKDGEVEYVRDLTGDKEQTVGVRDGDKYYTVHIGNREIYNAFDSDEMKGNEIFEALVHSFRGITSTMGANATSRNIEFGLVNLDKDQQQALAENLVYRSKKGDFWNFAKNAIKNIPSAAKTFIKYTMGKDDADTRMFREFLENGGSTGYMDVYRLVDDAKDLEARIDEATLGFFEKWKKWKDQGKITQNMIAKAKEITGRLLKPLELVNDLFEQTTRFANYKTARKFMSAARAAELSKNLTLNFNRHGKMWRSQWNWMYMFSNASLQGTAKTMRMYEKAFSQDATPEQRTAARSILMFSFGAGIMAEILGHAFSKKDDDDLKYYDKLEASIKDNNVVIMNPASKSGKNYIKLPLFIGGAFPYMMGRNAAAMMIGSQSIAQSVSNVVQNMEDYFSPLGTAAPNKEGKGDIVKKVAPTSLRPFLDVSYNSNFAGSRIYAQSMNSNKPAYTRAFKKTPMFYVELSRILSKITGGNTLEKGSVDIPPEAIQHIVESYAGGTGKFVGRTLETARKIVKGEELDTGNIPIVRRFTDDVGDSHVYDEFRKIQEVYRTVTTAEKDRNKELLEKYPKHRNLVNLMKRYNPRLTRLDKKLERNQIDMDTYRSEYVSILKQINKDGRKYIQQK